MGQTIEIEIASSTAISQSRSFVKSQRWITAAKQYISKRDVPAINTALYQVVLISSSSGL